MVSRLLAKAVFAGPPVRSGCDASMKQGLEIGGIAIGDVVNHTAFHYEALQTPNADSLKNLDKSLLAHYADLIIERQNELLKFSSLLVVDAYFSKCAYVDKILKNIPFDIISRLRDDAVLYYVYQGKPTGKRGRPQIYDGKVDVLNPSMNHFEIVYQDTEIRIFSAIVFVKSLGRKVKLALVIGK